MVTKTTGSPHIDLLGLFVSGSIAFDRSVTHISRFSTQHRRLFALTIHPWLPANKAAWAIQIENMKRGRTLTEWYSMIFQMGKAIPGGVLVVKERLLRILLASSFEAWTHPSPETKAHICIEDLQFCADFLFLVDVHVHLGECVRVSAFITSLPRQSDWLTWLQAICTSPYTTGALRRSHGVF